MDVPYISYKEMPTWCYQKIQQHGCINDFSVDLLGFKHKARMFALTTAVKRTPAIMPIAAIGLFG